MCGGGSQRWPELREIYERPAKASGNYEDKEAAWRKKKATAREAATGTLRVSILDVGQGDSILIQWPAGKTMLVDAGDADAGSRIVADLKAQFRCGGCAEYLDWINYLFGFST